MKTESLLLRAGGLSLLLRPAVGGSIARLWSEGAGGPVEWLRPAPGTYPPPGGPLDMACFPLVPFSNRIRQGRFPFRGREIVLPLNFQDHPHAIHGHGWRNPWRVTVHETAGATLEFTHEPDAWPFRYQARQEFQLDPDGLTATLTLRNLGESGMPAGLGFHPYFPRTRNTRLTATVGQVWLTDHEVMPIRPRNPPEDWNPARGLRVDAVALDHVFTGWKRTAVIDWPETGRRLTLSAGEGLGFLVVYSPPGQPFFCAEPVSHCTDAFNRAAQGETNTGMRELAPGESWSVTMELRPERVE